MQRLLIGVLIFASQTALAGPAELLGAWKASSEIARTHGHPAADLCVRFNVDGGFVIVVSSDEGKQRFAGRYTVTNRTLRMVPDDSQLETIELRFEVERNTLTVKSGRETGKPVGFPPLERVGWCD